MKDPNNCIARRLKQACFAFGVSQRKLGILAGISAPMNQYEKGTHIPNLLILQHISKTLGYPVAFFVSDDDLMAELVYLTNSVSRSGQAKNPKDGKGIGFALP